MSKNNFKCLICNSIGLEKSEISILKCKHVFCWHCIGTYITNNLSSSIKCPTSNCNDLIDDTIIRKAIPEDKINEYDNFFLSKVVNDNDCCFKCLLTDCGHIVFYDNNEAQYDCENCSLFNCTSCKGVHPLLSCDEYQEAKGKALKNEKDRLSLKSMEDAEFAKAQKELNRRRSKKWLSDMELLDSFYNLPNDDTFQCPICYKIVSKGDGTKLRNCFHTFCKSCLHDGIVPMENIPIVCLMGDCETRMEDREIRGILTDHEYEIFKDKSLNMAKSMLGDVFHCQKIDCKFVVVLESPNIEKVICPVCSSINCVPCIAIHHPEQTCEEYQITKKTDTKNREYIEEQIKKGECMECPHCRSLITKTDGCNWIKCYKCKLEICWMLKMRRWGPKGRNDETGGCKCRLGNRCHPDCGGCGAHGVAEGPDDVHNARHNICYLNRPSECPSNPPIDSPIERHIDHPIDPPIDGSNEIPGRRCTLI